MLDQLQALRALHEAGTTGRAATRLRISQSAVSKRIAALEERLGVVLVEREGRGVRLSPAAVRLLDDVLPKLRDLEQHLGAIEAGPARIRLAATESLVASWLPAALRRAIGEAGVEVEIHAHRGPLAVERLRAGEVDLAVVVSAGEDGLRAVSLGVEPMVVVGSGFGPVPAERPLEVWTIEAGSLTGAWLGRRLVRHKELVAAARIESFASAVQLARAGFGHALVPRGIADAMGAPTEACWEVPGLARPISALGRAGAWDRPGLRRLVEALRRGRAA